MILQDHSIPLNLYPTRQNTCSITQYHRESLCITEHPQECDTGITHRESQDSTHCSADTSSRTRYFAALGRARPCEYGKAPRKLEELPIGQLRQLPEVGNSSLAVDLVHRDGELAPHVRV